MIQDKRRWRDDGDELEGRIDWSREGRWVTTLGRSGNNSFLLILFPASPASFCVASANIARLPQLSGVQSEKTSGLCLRSVSSAFQELPIRQLYCSYLGSAHRISTATPAQNGRGGRGR